MRGFRHATAPAGDGTAEERTYYAQNWRGDVVALLDNSRGGGGRKETIRYSAYGTPFGMPAADANGSGTVNVSDFFVISGAFGESFGDPSYSVLADINLDGTVDASDSTIHSGQSGHSLGHGNLSRSPSLSGGVGNRLGYAGYAWEPVSSKYHVRHRVLDPLRGRWSRRDPLGYVDAPTLFAYVGNRALTAVDPKGLRFVQPVESPSQQTEPGVRPVLPPFSGLVDGGGGSGSVPPFCNQCCVRDPWTGKCLGEYDDDEEESPGSDLCYSDSDASDNGQVCAAECAANPGLLGLTVCRIDTTGTGLTKKFCCRCEGNLDIWLDEFMPDLPDIGDQIQAKSVIDHCIEVHEAIHLDEPCSVPADECKAYTRELACLHYHMHDPWGLCAAAPNPADCRRGVQKRYETWRGLETRSVEARKLKTRPTLQFLVTVFFAFLILTVDSLAESSKKTFLKDLFGSPFLITEQVVICPDGIHSCHRIELSQNDVGLGEISVVSLRNRRKGTILDQAFAEAPGLQGPVLHNADLLLVQCATATLVGNETTPRWSWFVWRNSMQQWAELDYAPLPPAGEQMIDGDCYVATFSRLLTSALLEDKVVLNLWCVYNSHCGSERKDLCIDIVELNGKVRLRYRIDGFFSSANMGDILKDWLAIADVQSPHRLCVEVYNSESRFVLELDGDFRPLRECVGVLECGSLIRRKEHRFRYDPIEDVHD